VAAHRYLASVTDCALPIQRDPRARLILASGSPRRREILAEAGVDFEVRPADIDEIAHAGEAPPALAERLAREKALAVATRIAGGPARPVLGSDTIVVRGDRVLGKPRDAAHAVELLSLLMGRRHHVLTAIAVCWSDAQEIRSQVVTSEVEMRSATRQELEDYVAVGESLDKAGGYALQGEGRRFVVGVHGSSSNVIGLPLEETLALLEASGHRPLEPNA
jgi:septum formation protein